MRPAVRYVLAVVAALVAAVAGAACVYAGEAIMHTLGTEYVYAPAPLGLDGPMPTSNVPATETYHYLTLLIPLLAAALTAAARVLSPGPFRRGTRGWWLGFAIVITLLGALYLNPGYRRYSWELGLGLNVAAILVGLWLARSLGRARTDHLATRWMGTIAAGIVMFSPVMMQTVFTGQWALWVAGVPPLLSWPAMTGASAAAAVLAASAWHRRREAHAGEAPAPQPVPATT